MHVQSSENKRYRVHAIYDTTSGLGLNRFDAIRLLEKLRNKRLVFVVDSLNRNQWASLVCMLEASIPDGSHKMRTFNGSLIYYLLYLNRAYFPTIS